MYKNIDLQNKERYSHEIHLPKAKLEAAAERALNRLERNGEKFQDKMAIPINGWFVKNPKGFSLNRYDATDQVTWTTGMWTGMYWLAYQLTGEKKFRNVAESQLKHYIRTVQRPEELNDHDTGFKYIPSCLAAYQITGNESARKAALEAARIQMDHFCKVNKFIIRSGTRSEKDHYMDYRTLVDSMMNIPLFFWAYEQTGDRTFYDAAVGHYHTTAKYLIREDGSSYHHYQFDPVTFKPVCGVTHQGNSDKSCWTRGHSWLVYGYPVAYKYTKDEEIIDIHKAVSYYFMDYLPMDGIPYWDFDFTDGCIEPKDSSASAIAVCGLMEMNKYLPDTAEQKYLFKNAANLMLETLIDKCENRNEETDCMLLHVTGSRPHCIGVDNCETYGDYFYLEALARVLKPELELFW